MASTSTTTPSIQPLHSATPLSDSCTHTLFAPNTKSPYFPNSRVDEAHNFYNEISSLHGVVLLTSISPIEGFLFPKSFFYFFLSFMRNYFRFSMILNVFSSNLLTSISCSVPLQFVLMGLNNLGLRLCCCCCCWLEFLF